MTGFFLHPNSKEEIIDSYDEDIIVTNHAGFIVKASQISGRHYGLKAKELLGKSVYDLEKKGIFSPAITPLVLEQKKKVVAIQTTPSGGKALITGMPFFNELGEVEFVLSYSYEVEELLVIQEYMKELENEMALAKEELSLLRKEHLMIEGLTIENRSTRIAYETARNAAALDVSVVLYGEPGTGKSTMAKVIHNESVRKNGPFIEVDCETLPEAMFERELFGGEFEQKETGLLTLSNGGTLYLKGIDKLSLHLQGKLAHVLKERKYIPFHGETALPLNIRLISSSESLLTTAVSEKAFHSDLYYLLHIVPIHLKPLRERKEDLSALISNYLTQFSTDYKTVKNLSNDVFNQLIRLDWPGNVDELKNVIERLVVQSNTPIITANDLPPEYRNETEDDFSVIHLGGRTLPSILEDVEMKVLKDAQERYRTTTEMAKFLGISQPSVVRKLKKYIETE
ncbi:sigma 54-interacting transcriptional regulator [Sporosarcina sp. G11-34]|uniref:sigma 54-interacting transcriptional regulator n=1 Tax=Sporosarcina sp. G11-34 TaxID=2849605 RepID=UPI0022A8DFEB|nr:sigma 54-interacting transcriptional regulator [Sporosarcina sp. G11-34]MCZ2258330.1 sigma 54-interacting transcriptional regulator [Sporosarcina sp. G11-34]